MVAVGESHNSYKGNNKRLERRNPVSIVPAVLRVLRVGLCESDENRYSHPPIGSGKSKSRSKS